MSAGYSCKTHEMPAVSSTNPTSASKGTTILSSGVAGRMSPNPRVATATIDRYNEATTSDDILGSKEDPK